MWGGLTVLLALQVWNPFGMPEAPMVGAVLMIIGYGLYLFDK